MTIFLCKPVADGRGADRGFAPGLAGLPQRIFGKMMLATALILASGSVVAQQMSVPSGLEVRLFDVLLEEEPQVARFRFVVPAIDPAGEAKAFAEVVDDLQYLCDAVVVPALAQNTWTGEQVVLSLSSAETEFGFYDPDVWQFFQPFQITDASCIWEDF